MVSFILSNGRRLSRSVSNLVILLLAATSIVAIIIQLLSSSHLTMSERSTYVKSRSYKAGGGSRYSSSNNPLDYTVIIIHYHKTGSALSKSLLNLILEEGSDLGLVGTPRNQKRSRKIQRHEREQRPANESYEDQELVDDDDSENDEDDDDIRSNAGTERLLHRENAELMKSILTAPKNPRFFPEYPKRQHDRITKCPKLLLIPGMVFVQTAPDLFCSIDDLRDILIPSLTALRIKNNGTVRLDATRIEGHERQLRGTKILHLVRNPFDMALSNYFYHSQIPTPEGWVHNHNPCEDRYIRRSPLMLQRDRGWRPRFDRREKMKQRIVPQRIVPFSQLLYYNETTKNLALPALTNISPEQYDEVLSLCHALFQSPMVDASLNITNTSSFYEHLIGLNSYDGLRLAITQQIVGSGGANSASGGDILRMGNNVVKLRQLIKLNEEDLSSNKMMWGELQLLTMDMLRWTTHPSDSVVEALDFVFGDSLSLERKQAAAMQYEETYTRKASNDTYEHVTFNKHDRSEKKHLISMLRNDAVLAPVLAEVESILANA